MKIKKIKKPDKVYITYELKQKEYDFMTTLKVFSMNVNDDNIDIETLNNEDAETLLRIVNDFLRSFNNLY